MPRSLVSAFLAASLAALVGVAACGQAADQRRYEDAKIDTQLIRPPPPPGSAPPDAERAPSPAALAMPSDAAAAPAPPEAQGGHAGAPAPGAALAPATPMLAYAYRYGIEIPGAQVRPLMERHQKACEDAGPLQCQVTAAEANTEGRDFGRASLQLRATPQWLTHFRAGLETDARGAGGRVAATNTSTTDLTRAIVDTDAMLRTRSVLRDRLERLLAERPGNLRDVLQLETEISRVQGEIDAAQSELAVMRARVAMSEMTITYQATGVPAPDGVASPLQNSLNNVLAIFVSTVAFIVTVLAFLLPWAVVIGVPLWIFRKRLPKFGRRPPPAYVAPPVSPPTPPTPPAAL